MDIQVAAEALEGYAVRMNKNILYKMVNKKCDERYDSSECIIEYLIEHMANVEQMHNVQIKALVIRNNESNIQRPDIGGVVEIVKKEN